MSYLVKSNDKHGTQNMRLSKQLWEK